MSPPATRHPARYFALIPAAGVGSRMGAQVPKQYLPLCGQPMLAHSLAPFIELPAIEHSYVVVSAEDGWIDSLDLPAQRVTVLRVGGDTRQASVLNGLRALQGKVADEDWVLVHDAARPGLSVALLQQMLTRLAEDDVGGLLALPLVDTIKQAGGGERAQATVPREGLWAAQTPQMFRRGLLEKALSDATSVTDEASAIEALGLQPLLLPGSVRNMKVTRPEDLQLAELLLKMPA